MKKAVKIANWVFTGVLVLAVAGLAFLYFVPGYNLYLVRSESMKPTINMGDLIITGPKGGPVSGAIIPGKIITFEHNGELVTHRLQKIDGELLVTKGDAVKTVDPWTTSISAIRGLYLFKIPYIGYVTNFVQTKVGWFVMIIIPATGLVLWLVKDIFKEALNPGTQTAASGKRE